MPQVRLAAEPVRLRLLVEYAERAGCGLETDDEGLVTVCASSVLNPHRLARLIVEDCAVFASLERLPWMVQALEVLDQEEVGELGDN